MSAHSKRYKGAFVSYLLEFHISYNSFTQFFFKFSISSTYGLTNLKHCECIRTIFHLNALWYLINRYKFGENSVTLYYKHCILLKFRPHNIFVEICGRALCLILAVHLIFVGAMYPLSSSNVLTNLNEISTRHINTNRIGSLNRKRALAILAPISIIFNNVLFFFVFIFYSFLREFFVWVNENWQKMINKTTTYVINHKLYCLYRIPRFVCGCFKGGKSLTLWFRIICAVRSVC